MAVPWFGKKGTWARDPAEPRAGPRDDEAPPGPPQPPASRWVGLRAIKLNSSNCERTLSFR